MTYEWSGWTVGDADEQTLAGFDAFAADIAAGYIAGDYDAEQLSARIDAYYMGWRAPGAIRRGEYTAADAERASTAMSRRCAHEMMAVLAAARPGVFD